MKCLLLLTAVIAVGELIVIDKKFAERVNSLLGQLKNFSCNRS